MESKVIGNISGKEIREFILTSGKTQVNVINFGGIVTKFIYDGVDVALGYDTLAEYEKTGEYYGATIGRVCNRIAFGRFSLNGKTYQLPVNNGKNSLHGGNKGFNKRVFDYELDGEKLILSYLSKDKEEGYPANLSVKVIFCLDDEGLRIEYNAKADDDTVCNMTNHTYFNLNGHGNGDVLNHELKIDADYILPINANYVPTGDKLKVENTPFDFKDFHKVGERVNGEHEQLKIANGYDHAYALNGSGFRKVATLKGDISQIKLDVMTDQKSVQLYGGNFIDNDTGKDGRIYIYHSAICLETQGYPNAINCKEYPSVVLKKGDTYISKTVYKLYR